MLKFWFCFWDSFSVSCSRICYAFCFWIRFCRKPWSPEVVCLFSWLFWLINIFLGWSTPSWLTKWKSGLLESGLSWDLVFHPISVLCTTSLVILGCFWRTVFLSDSNVAGRMSGSLLCELSWASFVGLRESIETFREDISCVFGKLIL